jgi:uncharacterized Fe-S cluster protein YjdI
MSSTITKEYSNGEITVVWKPNTCIHSEKCWRGLGAVFQPKQKPWINLEGATSEAIMKQVDQCPSGALSWYRNAEGKPKSESSTDVQVEVSPNGPLLVKGKIEVKLSNGRVEQKEKMTALCRCGHSTNKPYCDGSHKREGWTE